MEFFHGLDWVGAVVSRIFELSFACGMIESEVNLSKKLLYIVSLMAVFLTLDDFNMEDKAFSRVTVAALDFPDVFDFLKIRAKSCFNLLKEVRALTED